MVISLLLVLGVSIGISASTNYDRQEVDACITISQRLSVKTSYGKSSKNLQFDKNDMVYGPSANGKLLELQRKSGGKLLSDIGNPYENGYGDDWLSFSTDTIENTINAGYKIRFDLTYMDDIDGVLNGTGKYANSITAGELRYIQDNWSRLSGGVIFYFNGEEVLPPWMN